jgi:hypothetical protein
VGACEAHLGSLKKGGGDAESWGNAGKPSDPETVASGDGADDVVSGGGYNGLDDGDGYGST